MAKGAAPSRDLVRTGIENVLKEVLGALATGWATDGDRWMESGSENCEGWRKRNFGDL